MNPLSWIGSLLSLGPAFFSWLNKKEDVSLEKFKVNGQVDQALLAAHVSNLKARRDVLVEGMKYRGFRWCQYGIMVPYVLWWANIVFYCIFHPYFPAIKPVLALPDNLQYIGSGVVGLLLLTSKIDDWTRKT